MELLSILSEDWAITAASIDRNKKARCIKVYLRPAVRKPTTDGLRSIHLSVRSNSNELEGR